MTARFSASDVKRLERTYMRPEIAEQRARTRKAIDARAGERGLDVGCGPGFLTCELARQVGPAGRIVGMDASEEMLEAARARAERDGLADRIKLAAGDAARLDFPDASFDFVAAVQVYLYVAEIERALSEAVRVLRPSGRLVVVDTDWDTCVWRTADRARHRRIIDARLRHFAQPHLPPELPRLLRDAGLVLRQAGVIPILDVRYDAASFSAEAIAITRAVAVRQGIPAEEAEAWAADLRSRTMEGEYFFSLNRFFFLATKP